MASAIQAPRCWVKPERPAERNRRTSVAGCAHRPLFLCSLKSWDSMCSAILAVIALGGCASSFGMHASTCMGAGYRGAMGQERPIGKDGLERSRRCVGDSTFFSFRRHPRDGPPRTIKADSNHDHSWISGITAMTGQQDHSGTGYTIQMSPRS